MRALILLAGAVAMAQEDRVLTSDAAALLLSFSDDGKSLAAYCTDNKIRLWDAGSGKLQKTIDWKGKDSRGVLLPPGAKWLLAAGNDKVVKSYDLVSGDVRQRLEGHEQQTGRLALSRDGKLAASSSAGEKRVRVWDMSSGKQKHALIDGIGGTSEMAFSPDGGTLVVANYDTDVRVFDTRSGELIRKVEELPVSMFALSFSPDGKYFASAGVDRTVYIWDAKTWRLSRKLTGSPFMISAMSFSPDGKQIVTGGFDETTLRNPVKVQFWDFASGNVLRTVDAPHRVSSAVFSPDSRWAALAAGDVEIRLWKAPGK